MISITTLYGGRRLASHELRYGRGRTGPVVVFNCTDRCNLCCAHCYSASGATGGVELTTRQATDLLDDLAAAGAPAVLLSGGEPLLREDLTELVAHARRKGIHPVISTNGTLLTPGLAAALAQAGAGYVGVSIDGAPDAHDRFRGRTGAFEQAVAGIAHCRQAGLKVGIRMTLTAENAADADSVFDLVASSGVQRLCFYHLVPAGRGRDLFRRDLDHRARRKVLNRILDRTTELERRPEDVEVLTVDNHADGPYLVLRLMREDPARAGRAMDLLRSAGGNASGVRLACVRADGTVVPDPFWPGPPLGNVRQRPFGRIWSDASIPLLRDLRRRPRPLTGRCLRCRWLEVCNGNLRSRALAAGGDPWGDDPSCYLSEREISTEPPADQADARAGQETVSR